LQSINRSKPQKKKKKKERVAISLSLGVVDVYIIQIDFLRYYMNIDYWMMQCADADIKLLLYRRSYIKETIEVNRAKYFNNLFFFFLFFQALNGFLLILTSDGEVFFATHTIESYLGFHQVKRDLHVRRKNKKITFEISGVISFAIKKRKSFFPPIDRKQGSIRYISDLCVFSCHYTSLPFFSSLKKLDFFFGRGG